MFVCLFVFNEKENKQKHLIEKFPTGSTLMFSSWTIQIQDETGKIVCATTVYIS